MKTLKDLKVGDKAFDVRFGEVTIKSVSNYGCYPIRAIIDDDDFSPSYTLDGKLHSYHTLPTLFVSNPFITNQGKWMMVSDCNVDWCKRFVFAEKCGKFIAWNYAETDEELLNQTDTTSWKYAKEIEEETIPEYTMEQLVAKLGNFKIKK
jgi:hypothetical protein